MRCRKINYIYDNDNVKSSVVWFGSAGKIDENIARVVLYGLPITNYIKDSEEDNLYTYTSEENILLIDEDNHEITFNNDEPIEYTKDEENHRLNFEINNHPCYIEILSSKITPTKYTENETNINYSEEQFAVRDSLVQRLSILKKELWYRANYGLPLFEKIRNKGIFDAIVIDIITSHPDVKNLISFASEIDFNKHVYKFAFSALTVYTADQVQLNLTINN